jgi:hypothetical protein
MGLTVGNGTQDDYAKLVVTAGGAGLSGGGSPGIEFLKEVAGQVQTDVEQSAAVADAQAVDLWLEVDPAARTVTPSYSIKSGGVAGPVTELPAEPIPAGWLNGSTGLALGIISTSVGGHPFPATWDLFEATPVQGPGTPPAQPPPVPGLTGQAPGPGIAQPVAPSVAHGPKSVVIATRQISVRGGVAQLRLSCPRAGPRCVGDLQLETVSRVAVRAGSTRRRIVVGRARYRIAAGSSATVPVKLSSQGRRLLARSRAMRVVISVTVRGTAHPSARRTITLRAPRPPR